jgi:effector-binding domain-containing protein
MEYEVELTKIPEQIVACYGGRGPMRDLRERESRLTAALAGAGVTPEGPLMARFFDQDYDPADTNYEVCLARPADEGDALPDRIADVRTAIIPAHHALLVRHQGPYSTLGDAHEALKRELDAVGYTLAGPVTEIFVVGPQEGREPADYLTELRYPIAR